MTDRNGELLEHEYDGIQEMDNNLPRWWLYLFYFTIVWGIGYFLYFHVFGIGYLQIDEYRQEINPSYVRISEGEIKLLGLMPEYRSPLFNPRGDATPRRIAMSAGGPSVPVLLTSATDTIVYESISDPALLAAGQKAFEAVCAQCHGKLGEGGVGPNLVDNYWIHGADFSGIVRSITYGYPAQGMIPWRGTLKPEEIINVASYVMTMRGTNPPNAKAPQGNPVEE